MGVEELKAILREIPHPRQGAGDIVSSGCISELELKGREVHLRLRLDEPIERSVRHALEDQVYNLLVEQEGIDDVELEVELPEESLPQGELTSSEPNLSHHGAGTSATAEKAPEPESPLSKIKHLVAVASGKGGVGKSTVAVNLALSLKARGARVAICDVDVYGPSVPILMGVRGAKVKVDPQEKRFLPVEAYGVGVVSIAFLIEEQTPVIWRGPIVGSVVKQFLNDVQWGELDYLILDLPPGTGDVQLTLTQSASLTGAVIVTTPSVLAVADSIKGMQMFRKVEIPILGVVENMSHYACPDCGHESAPFSEGGAEEMCEQFGTKLLGRIPMDIQTQRGGDRGEPIAVKAPESAPAQAFGALADQLIEKLPFQEAETAEGEHRAGLLSKLFKR